MVPNRTLVFAALSVAAIIPLLSGCAAVSGGTASTPRPSSTETEPSVELTVFAAASLTEPFDELGELFMQQNPGVIVKSVYDGSSTLATQLIEGAGADVFASADEATMARVADAGALDGTALPFASNTLQIAVRPGNPLGIRELFDLASSEPIVVLCAPEVPCGAASAAVLMAADVRVTPASEEQNVKAVVTKVQLGEADAGLVYATDVLAANGGIDGVSFGEALLAVNHYLIGSPAAAPNPETAGQFIEFLRSPEGQRVLADHGFGPQ